jgi:hypothetical protein
MMNYNHVLDFSTGFTFNNIFSLSYSNGDKTADRRWFVPNDVVITRAVSCAKTVDNVEVKDTKTYKEKLEVDASLEIGNGETILEKWFSFGKFSLSGNFKRMSEETNSQNIVSQVG